MLQTLGPLGPVPSLLIGLLALAVVILVGRFLLNAAWKLVMIALLAVTGLWVVGSVGLLG